MGEQNCSIREEETRRKVFTVTNAKRKKKVGGDGEAVDLTLSKSQNPKPAQHSFQFPRPVHARLILEHEWMGKNRNEDSKTIG
jgi:hypothetical protein